LNAEKSVYVDSVAETQKSLETSVHCYKLRQTQPLHDIQCISYHLSTMSTC